MLEGKHQQQKLEWSFRSNNVTGQRPSTQSVQIWTLKDWNSGTMLFKRDTVSLIDHKIGKQGVISQMLKT